MRLTSVAGSQTSKKTCEFSLLQGLNVFRIVRQAPNYLDLISYLEICKENSIKRSYLILKG